MLHLGITNIQLRYVLVFTMCANLLVMRLFEVATSLRYWNNSDCICCYPPGTCYPNETGFWQPYSGCKSHKTRPIGLCWWFFRDPDTPTHTHTSCSHLNTSKIALQKMRTNSYKYRKSTESTDMRTIRQSTVSKPIEGVYIYIYWSSVLTGPSCGSWACSRDSGNLTSVWEETCVKNKAPKSTLNHGTHGCNSICPYLSSSDWHKSNITKWSRVAMCMT